MPRWQRERASVDKECTLADELTGKGLEIRLLRVLAKAGRKPTTLQEVMRKAGLATEAQEEALSLLQELCREGTVVEQKGGRFALPKAMNLRAGRVQAHAEGFGFLVPDNPDEEDLYLSAPALRPAMHGDQVLATVERFHVRGRAQGRVFKVLERGHKRLLGTYHRSGRSGRLTPTDPRIAYYVAIPPRLEGKATNGEVVEAEILKYPTAYSDIEARVVTVLGQASDPRVDTEVVVRKFNLPTEFPSSVIEEASKLPKLITPSSTDKMEDLPLPPKRKVAWHELPLPSRGSRVDLRPFKLFTIDGENARDFDDAVGIAESHDGGIRLIVAIADVEHYAPAGSILDAEAQERGTSVYFPDRVLPMFPEALSNGIASLNPEVDRLVLAVAMQFDRRGQLVASSFHRAVMQSAARLTYTQVRQILVDHSPAEREQYAPLIDDLERMAGLAQLLAKKRRRRGSIDFDLPEAEILLDMRGRPENIVKAERSIAHRMIEEFMIAANEAVAAYLTAMDVPMLYRVHEPPEEETIRGLARFLEGFGIRLPRAPGAPKPAALEGAVAQAQGKAEERLINRVILRSMKQARYAPENLRHFGLASKCYTHFTSPIRRYPDLFVHRQLKLLLAGKRKQAEQNASQIESIAEQSSKRERVAMEAEREVVDLKKVQFMQDKLGEEYDGFISSVVPFGLFIELSTYFVEGLVHISTLLDDFYDYEEENYSLRGRRRGRVFRLGDSVRVRLASVSVERRQIDFALVDGRK